MTADDLDNLTKLDAAATPGPWYVRLLDDEYAMSAVAVATEPETDTLESMRMGTWPEGLIVAACLIQQPAYVMPEDDRYDENAALIAAMRTALPELLRLAKIGLDAETRLSGL